MKALLRIARSTRILLHASFLYGTFAILTAIFVFADRRFASTEVVPHIDYLFPRLAKDWLGKFSVVRVGMIAINMPEFDTKKNEFILNALVWFEFNPLHVSQDTIGNFSFEEGDILYRSEPQVVVKNDLLLVQYQIKVRFSSALAYHYFPFDDHSIFLILTNRSVSTDEVVFTSDSSALTFAKTFSLPGWRMNGYQVAFGQLSANTGQRRGAAMSVPAIRFGFDFDKMGLIWVITLILPLMIIFYLAMVVLLFARAGGDTGPVLMLSTIAVLLSYRFVIQTVQPSVGYLTVIDYLYLFDIIAALFAFLINAWARDAQTDSKLLHIMKGYAPPIMCLALLAIVSYALFFHF